MVIIFVQIIVISSCWGTVFLFKSSSCKKCLRRVVEIRFPFVVPSCDRFQSLRVSVKCLLKPRFVTDARTVPATCFQIALWTYTAIILLATKNCWPGVTPWSRILLEKLTGLQLVKKLPEFYGTRRFITAFTSARSMSLSWASPIQSIPHIPLP